MTDSGAPHWMAALSALPELGLCRRAPRERTAWAYRWSAFIHPSNLIALASFLMLGAITPSGPILLFGLGVELLFLFIAPRSQRLRRVLDEGMEEVAEASAGRARDALIAKMADGHRDELGRLDGLIKKTRQYEAGATRRPSADDDLDLQRLTSSYIRLALAHKACEEALSLSEPRPLRTSARALEAAQQSASKRVHAALGERLRVVERRTAYEARLREDLEVITHQLATIAEFVCLRHQEALTLGPSTEADRFTQDLEETRSAVRELAELDGGERRKAVTIACA